MAGYGLDSEIHASADILPLPSRNFKSGARAGVSPATNEEDFGLLAEASLGGGVAPTPPRPPAGRNARRPGSDQYGLQSELPQGPGRTGFASTADDEDPVFAPQPKARLPPPVNPKGRGQQDQPGKPSARSRLSRPQSRGDDAGPMGDNTKRQGGPPRQMYPQDDFGGDMDEMFRKKAEQLISRQTASRLASQQLDRQVDAMTRRPPTQREAEAAALTIQRHYRGYQVRRQVTLPSRQRQQPWGQQALIPAGQFATPDQQMRQRRGVTINAPEQIPRRPLQNIPVIDIDKMPRYGILAQPLARLPKEAQYWIEYDRQTNTLIRNRGALREALEHKSGYLENRAVTQWVEFTKRQKERYVPIPPDANRRVLPDTKGYRLRILRINDLPIHTTHDGRIFEFQLGVSLYDEAYGTFYGNTVYSMADSYDRGRAQQKNAIDLDFSFDVW